jgi:hypothetical protein
LTLLQDDLFRNGNREEVEDTKLLSHTIVKARLTFLRARQLQTSGALASFNQTYYGPTSLRAKSLIDGSQNTRLLELSGSQIEKHETGCKYKGQAHADDFPLPTLRTIYSFPVKKRTSEIKYFVLPSKQEEAF